MAINTEVTFVDAVTVVDAAWLNLLQEHLAGLVTLEIDTPTSTQVRITSGSDDIVSAIYIGGEQRFRDTNVSHTFVSESSGTYDVYVTAPDGVDSFELEVTQGTPGVSPYRKIGTVEWNGAAITAVRGIEGRNIAHVHSSLDGSGLVSHVDTTGLASGDPHTQYIHKDGSRPFTSPVVGVTPTLDGHLATKGYIDGISVPGLPIGTILPFAGDTDTDLPPGWKLCDGTSYDTTAEATLFAIIAYVYGGAGADFNVPDLRQRIALGKAASGTGSTLGGTGGSWDHVHTQPTHSHTTTAHTHTTTAHTHDFPVSGGPSVEHAHAQGSTGSDGAHTHTGPSHSHGVGTLVVANSGKEIVGSVHASQATAGVYAESDLDNSSSSTSHTHGSGTLSTTGAGAIGGTSSSATASHTHAPSGNSYEHTHAAGAESGSTGSGGTAATSSDGSHTHTSPSTSTSTEGHTHSGGTSGGTAPSVNSGGAGSTSSDGDEATGSAQPPVIEMNYIIRSS